VAVELTRGLLRARLGGVGGPGEGSGLLGWARVAGRPFQVGRRRRADCVGGRRNGPVGEEKGGPVGGRQGGFGPRKVFHQYALPQYARAFVHSYSKQNPKTNQAIMQLNYMKCTNLFINFL